MNIKKPIKDWNKAANLNLAKNKDLKKQTTTSFKSFLKSSYGKNFNYQNIAILAS